MGKDSSHDFNANNATVPVKSLSIMSVYFTSIRSFEGIREIIIEGGKTC